MYKLKTLTLPLTETLATLNKSLQIRQITENNSHA